jgi:hypothetical protein
MAYVPPRRSRRKGPKPDRRPPNSPDRRQALEFLAACPDGCTEALMLANGFAVDLMLELVRAGLASATRERVVGDGETVEIARVRMPEAGRRALTAARKP